MSPPPTERHDAPGAYDAEINVRDWRVLRGEPRLARLLDSTTFTPRRPGVAIRGTDLAGIVEAGRAAITGVAAGESGRRRHHRLHQRGLLPGHPPMRRLIDLVDACVT